MKLSIFGAPIVCMTLLMVGCGTYPSSNNEEIKQKAMQIGSGMNKQEVIALMGSPEQRSFRGQAEALTFCGWTVFQGFLIYTVWFFEEAVVAMTDDYVHTGAGDCSQFLSPVDWGQAPPDVRIKLDISSAEQG